MLKSSEIFAPFLGYLYGILEKIRYVTRMNTPIPVKQISNYIEPATVEWYTFHLHCSDIQGAVAN